MKTYHYAKLFNGYQVVNHAFVPCIDGFCETRIQARKLAAIYTGLTVRDYCKYLKQQGKLQEVIIPREYYR